MSKLKLSKPNRSVVNTFISNWASSYDEQFIKQIWKYLYDRGLNTLESQADYLKWCPDGLEDVSIVKKIITILSKQFNGWVIQQTIYALEDSDECG